MAGADVGTAATMKSRTLRQNVAPRSRPRAGGGWRSIIGRCAGLQGWPEMYVYIRSEPHLFTVGFYSPSGEWHPESDHHSREDAAKRVAWLNGSKEV